MRHSNGRDADTRGDDAYTRRDRERCMAASRRGGLEAVRELKPNGLAASVPAPGRFPPPTYSEVIAAAAARQRPAVAAEAVINSTWRPLSSPAWPPQVCLRSTP